MSINKLIPTTFLLFFVFLLAMPSLVSADHFEIRDTDTADLGLASFFDLRERESFVQVTNTNNDVGDSGGDEFTPGSDVVVHVQIFNVDDDCNENNFYDTYTPNDTHVYNMRDIQTNDTNPSGVVLPDNAYGFVVITLVDGVGQSGQDDRILIGNFRVIDNSGYEYRTNSLGLRGGGSQPSISNAVYTVNFNTLGNVTFSDIISISLFGVPTDDGFGNVVEWTAELTDTYKSFNVDILDNSENIFSCRNVIFACIDQDNPRLEELLEFVANDGTGGDNPSASVASFEYGINEAIPHSRGSELLCPGNNISEGFVQFTLNQSIAADRGGPPHLFLTGFVGLNNGNGRGSMDSWWSINCNSLGCD